MYVANDSQAAALAEWTFGRHAPARGMVVVKVGNGIGAGIIIEDRLYQGDGFGAGEIGHISVAANDLRCRCGRTGCLETVASVRAVHARIAALTGQRRRRTDLARRCRAPSQRSVAAFQAGDPAVVQVVIEAGHYLGRMLGHLVGTLDIHDIVLIGTMTAFGEPLAGSRPARSAPQRAAAARGRDPHRLRPPRLGHRGAGGSGAADDLRARLEPGGMTMLTEPGTGRPWSAPVVEPSKVEAGIVLGIDIGGTKTAAMVVDAADQVLGRAERPTDRGAPVRVAVEVARAAMSGAGLPMTSLRAVGVAVPGDVDARTGTVRLAVNLDALDLPLADLLGQVLGVPCFVEHDARAAATWLAARPGVTGDLAYLSIGTGIAAGVVLDGLPLAGDNGLAGEIGHCVADPDGPMCPCGLRGCLEAIAPGPAVARAAQTALDAGEASSLRDLARRAAHHGRRRCTRPRSGATRWHSG